MPASETRPTHVYIARKSCGCCVAVVSDMQDKNTGQHVGEFIADGLTIERIDFETYASRIANEPGFMKCPHGQQRLL